ncbi:MAG TPA: hypothetical protein VN442_05335 [Bryobacteraceae bacterium]|nr:hypothetical protein [Bryobacteraceae bacterium]
MLCAKVLDKPVREDAIRKELQYLYDRRSAVEMLIRSLEYYDRFADGSSVSLSRESA